MKGALFVFERKYESHISVIYLYFAPKIFELTNEFLLNLSKLVNRNSLVTAFQLILSSWGIVSLNCEQLCRPSFCLWYKSMEANNWGEG